MDLHTVSQIGRYRTFPKLSHLRSLSKKMHLMVTHFHSWTMERQWQLQVEGSILHLGWNGIFHTINDTSKYCHRHLFYSSHVYSPDHLSSSPSYPVVCYEPPSPYGRDNDSSAQAMLPLITQDDESWDMMDSKEGG